MAEASEVSLSYEVGLVAALKAEMRESGDVPAGAITAFDGIANLLMLVIGELRFLREDMERNKNA